MRRKRRNSFIIISLSLAMAGALCSCGNQQETDSEALETATVEEVEEETTSEEEKLAEVTETGTSEEELTDTEEPTTEEQVSEEPESEESATEDNGEGMRGDNAAEKGQIEILLENDSLWRDAFANSFYTVTDLDHNGRLELIVATNEGTGQYTYMEVYEVNESQDGIMSCYDGNDIEGGQLDNPDLIIDGNLITFTNGHQYVYICSDYVHISAAESLEYIDAFILENGIFGVNQMAEKHINGEEITYKSYPSEEEITEEEFNNISIDRYTPEGYTRSETTFKWTQLTSGSDSVDLLDTYLAFAAAGL